MNETQLSILQLCKNLLLCRKKDEQKPFKLNLTTNKIVEDIILKKNKKNNLLGLEQSDSYSLSFSSPNLLYTQVYENNSLKPKISIKYETLSDMPSLHKSCEHLVTKSQSLQYENSFQSTGKSFGKLNRDQTKMFQYECFSNESSLTSEPERSYISNKSLERPKRKYSASYQYGFSGRRTEEYCWVKVRAFKGWRC